MMNKFDVPKFGIAIEGRKVFVKGEEEASAKYGKIKTYMMYVETGKPNEYNLIIANYIPGNDVPAAKLFVINIARKTWQYTKIATQKEREGIMSIIQFCENYKATKAHIVNPIEEPAAPAPVAATEETPAAPKVARKRRSQKKAPIEPAFDENGNIIYMAC